MNDERTRRIGQNEALYRQVNERIGDLNESFSSITGDFAIVCECGNLDCMEQISLSREVYESARASPHRFIVKPGHEAQDVEDVVARDGNYVIIEKEPPAAKRLAEETDPRS